MSRLIIAPLLSLVVLSSASRVWAQTSFEAIGRTNTGYTSNRNPGTLEDPQADAFFELGAGLGFRSVNGRMLHALHYELTGTIFAQELGAASFQNALDYLSLYELGPRARLGLSASGRQGRQGSFRVNPTEQIVEPRRAGTVWFLGFAAQERLDYRVSSKWGLYQTAQTDWFIPTDNPFGDEGDLDPQMDSGRAATIEGSLGAQYSWSRLSLGVTPRGQYLVNFLRIGHDATWLFSLVATLRWAISPRWTVNAEAGAQLSVSGVFSEVRQPGPLLQGNLVYRDRRWRVDIAAAYQQTPSVQIAYILESATASLRGSVPLGPRRLQMWIDGMVGYAYSSPIGDIAAGQAVDIHTMGTDLAFNWRFSDYVEGAIHYQFGIQRSQGLSLLTAGEYAHDFSVHVGMLSFIFNYPGRRQQDRPRRRVRGALGVDQEEWDAIFDPTPGQRGGGASSTSSGGGDAGR